MDSETGMSALFAATANNHERVVLLLADAMAQRLRCCSDMCRTATVFPLDFHSLFVAVP